MRTKIYSSALILLIVAADMLAGQPEKPNEKLNKVTTAPTWTRFNINNISTVFTADGRSDNYTDAKKPAFEYPKGDSKYLFYQSGLIWGGKVSYPDTMQIRVTGAAYRTAMMPGHVVDGVPVDTSVDDRARIFRVRPDYATADLTSEVNSGEGTEAMVRAQYAKDWNEWPAELGAPYQDLDENGVYDPAVDIPGVNGADQTIWFVCNDFNINRAVDLYGSYPLGIEMQTTIWGYKGEGALGNTLFRKYVLINKSGKNIEEMYVSMWSDPDCGDGADDYAGIDKDKNLMYVYNGKANDAIYGYTPAAGGFDLLQGPIVDSPGGTGIFMGKKVSNKKNLPVTGFYYFINQNEIYKDPKQGNYQEGTLEFWNLLHGKIGTTGDDYPIPGGGVTNFPLDGDPLTNTGYVDGKLFPPGDRRMGMASGPFNFDAGDTQEVVLAQIAAGSTGIIDRLGALGQLKYYDDKIQSVYNNFYDMQVPFTLFPQVSFAGMDEEIVVNWSADPELDAIENFNNEGYKFEGYNVYQFPSGASSRKEGKIIATYDLNNGIGKIRGYEFSEELGYVLPVILQNGKDSGLQRYISIKNDALNDNMPLENGKQYYFAVSAYIYNPDTNAAAPVLYSPLKIFAVTPHTNISGGNDDIVNSGALSDNKILHEGSADASVKVAVVDPSQLKDANYEVAFEEQNYFVDQDGKWKPSDIIGKNFQKNMSSSSYVDGVAIYAPEPEEYILNFKVHLNSVAPLNFDGIRFTFPKGMTPKSGWYIDSEGNNVYGMPLTDSTYEFGSSAGTGNLVLADNAIINLQCSSLPVPFTVSYRMWKDGSTDPALNALGTIIFDTIYYNYKTLTVWNLTNTKTGEKLLTDQTVINRYDQLYENWLTSASDPVVNGLQVMVNGSYDIPLGFSSAVLYSGADSPRDVEGTSVSSSSIVLSNMNVFSGVASSKAADESLDLKRGTSKLSVLQKDIELRFTGVWNELGADSVATIKDGTGSVATLFLMRGTGASLANNPLNPNPGVNEPFTVRIPFEAWDITDNRQINVMVVDRFQNPVQKPYYVWNPNNRMYFYLVETPYSETVIKPADSEADSASWAMAAWSLHYKIGDIVKIKYTNPIRPGNDVFRFSTNASVIEIKDDGIGAPKEYELSQNYPNPFNPATTINFAVPRAGNVKITIYDMLGREIEILTDKEYSIGVHKIEWNASRYSSGVYFYRLESAGFSLAKKMLLIK